MVTFCVLLIFMCTCAVVSAPFTISTQKTFRYWKRIKIYYTISNENGLVCQTQTTWNYEIVFSLLGFSLPRKYLKTINFEQKLHFNTFPKVNIMIAWYVFHSHFVPALFNGLVCFDFLSLLVFDQRPAVMLPKTIVSLIELHKTLHLAG